MSEVLKDPLIMFCAGVGIPILAAMNAQLGSRLGSATLAAVLLLSVAVLSALIFHLILGSSAKSMIFSHPKHLYFAGCLMGFYILSVTTIAPRFGVGNAIFTVLLGQMAAAAIIDHFALFGAARNPLSIMRVSGISLMAIGLIIIQRA